MSDFLLELRSEEIPARMEVKACADLERLFRERLSDAGVEPGRIETYATPRRLALIARDLPAETEAKREERRGPREDAPDKAVEGFLRGAGLARNQLEVREEKKGRFYFAVIETPGRETADILAEAVPAIVRAFPWPKSMRWGEASRSSDSLRWVRPLSGIVALLDGEVVDFEIGGARAGRTTRGHRFMSEGEIEIAGVDDYADKLRAARVVLDVKEREAIILDGANAACAKAGFTLIEDDGLLAENAGLTEWPVPLLGRFDETFLDVPPEVIQLAMKTHQKYFSVADKDGQLTNAFVCTANIEAADGGAQIVEGNRKVLAARLADARFFWEQDLAAGLDAMAKKLSGIVFHEKLGTIADKVDRVAKLARWLVEERIVIPAKTGTQVTGAASSDLGPGLRRDDDEIKVLADKAERAAKLAKADLVSQMVYEFPELQGVMGGYYAAAAGETEEIAAAIRDHYKPVGQNDEVPTAPVTVAVSLADKLDTLFGYFAIDEKPTGSKDPFALRRSAISVLALLTANDIRIPLHEAIGLWRIVSKESVPPVTGGAFTDLRAFLADRLKVQQREAGVRHDLIDAVFAPRQGEDSGEDDIVRLLARVKALQAFMETESGAALLAGYKRAANILKKEKWDSPETTVIPQDGEEDPLVLVDDPQMREVVAEMVHPRAHLSYEPEPAEAALIAALDAAEPSARRAVAEERFADAMTALSGLRAPIDDFFDSVTVNDEDEKKRAARLDLLARITEAVHEVADFSKIEG